VEGAVAGELEAAAMTGRARVLRYGISDEQAHGVGLACGGTIDILVEPSVPQEAVAAARAGADRRSGGRVIVTALPPDAPGDEPGPWPPGAGVPPDPRLVVHADGRLAGSLGSTEADAELVAQAQAALARGLSLTRRVAGRQLFLEVFALRPRVVIVGAVPVAASLVRLARELDHETVVVDGRAAFATAERVPDADRLVVGWLDEVADDLALGVDDAVVVLSHDPKLDDPAIVTALQRGCRYVGAVGSRTTQAARRARLLAAGLEEAVLDRLRGPVGLDLGGRQPAETALAVMGEIVATRHGGSGRPLRELAMPAAAGERP
jgi:xanthine dehydrogenase accessory factor